MVPIRRMEVERVDTEDLDKGVFDFLKLCGHEAIWTETRASNGIGKEKKRERQVSDDRELWRYVPLLMTSSSSVVRSAWDQV